ncbi:hypothetical protein D1007_56970 [Hordeum vulgare]|nr:hypothetical protein D1007_56970 [Hordeum vulgare]
MDDARHVHAECRAVWVVVTAPGRPGIRRHSIGAEAAASDLAAHEQQALFVHPSVEREGQTTTASSSHALSERVNMQAELLMDREVLLYRSMDAVYDAWLARITQLVIAAGESQPPSRSQRGGSRDSAASSRAR